MSSRHAVRIVSFGYLHNNDTAPKAHLTFDLREHFRDPHALSPAMRTQTGLEREVERIVMTTPGVAALVASIAQAVEAYASGPSGSETVVAVGCAGGKHRAVVVAEQVARWLSAGLDVTVQHRDVARSVVERTADGRAVTPAEALAAEPDAGMLSPVPLCESGSIEHDLARHMVLNSPNPVRRAGDAHSVGMCGCGEGVRFAECGMLAEARTEAGR